MGVIETVAKFIEQYCSGPKPLLLALSGGPDSLALYYGLLAYQRKYKVSFHIAHIDHNWRLESSDEAVQLRQLADLSGIPFHLRKLIPSELEGNLEMACRIERYRFFAELCQIHSFQGVLVGHQQDDQSETVLKRVLEGAHWSCLTGLQSETSINGIRVWRPLLNLSKKEIYTFLDAINVCPFEDASNQDERFMRARMRKSMIPWLNKTFGKNVQSALINLSEEMQEVKEFFEHRSDALLTNTVHGPFGAFLDLQNLLPGTLLEIKHLLRSFCESHAICLSRIQYQLCAESLQKNAANQRYENGKKILFIDRKRLFLLTATEFKKENWNIELKDQIIRPDLCSGTFQEAWKGTFSVWLPEGMYQINHWQTNFSNRKKLDKWWTNHGVPAFLRSIFPVITQGTQIVHEFLSGRSFFSSVPRQKGVEVTLRYYR